MDEAEARQRLERMVAHTSDPVLTTPEVDDLVSLARRPDGAGNLPTNVATAATWAPTTQYVWGDVVTANPAAGRWWRCVLPGVSSATQPQWPSLIGTLATHSRIADGPGVLWEDIGGPWAPTWDLAAAAAEGWELKASKVAERYQFATDGQQFNRQQLIDHCQEQARIHRRRVVAAVPVVG